MSAESSPEPPSSSIPTRTTGGGWRWTPPSPEELQQQLTNYTIEILLGHGGMGAVYRGLQKGLERPVAIKILPPGIEKEDPSYAERFKNEAKLMARLEHPGIVPVYEFGQTSTGLLYFVMGFVDGSDVYQLLRTAPLGRLPPEHALAITAHVCDALSYAHDHGIVHRDIKPANILINSEGQVKVADFGLAKVDDPAERGFTQTGMAMGTPDYVAPEILILGTHIDGRADLYAVGVMLYQMLTGNVPRGAFKPASLRISSLDPRLDAIIDKAMQSDREDRYQSSGELRAALEPLFGRQVRAPDLQQYTTGMVRQAIPVSEHNQKAESARKKTAGVTRFLPWLIGSAVATGIIGFLMLGGDEAPKPGREPTPLAAVKVREKATPSTQPSDAKVESIRPKTSEKPKSTPPNAVKPSPPVAGASMSPSSSPAKPASPPPPVASSSAPSAAKTAPLAVSAASEPQFPTGQWVKLFTKIEDLPNSMRSGTKMVRIEDGWIRSDTDERRKLDIPRQLSGNYGIRARLSYSVGSDHTSRSEISLRYRPSTSALKYESYSAYVTSGGARQLLQRNTEGKYESLTGRDLAEAIRENDSYLLEFSAVGDLLVSRVNEDPPLVHQESRMGKDGVGYLYFVKAIRDIEVINLNGLPEAQALRILGVDEKGNDLRSLAARQEQQMAEQAQDALAAIPELKTLHEQLMQLTIQRVSTPFEAEVAKLNSGYLVGLDRKIAEERSRGSLDGVLTLEAEKNHIAAVDVTALAKAWPTTTPVPADDDKTSETLKSLRQIYRDAFTKLEATRVANLKALTDPLTIRLKQLESSLTQLNRIDHAKTVRDYRENLGKGDKTPVAEPPTPALSPGAQATAAPAKYPRGDDRKAAEWVLSLGGAASCTIQSPGLSARVLSAGDFLPRQSFVMTALDLAFGTTSPPPKIPINDLRPLAGLEDLETLRLSGKVFTEPMLEILPSLPKLAKLRIVGGTEISDSSVDQLKLCKSLTSLTLEDTRNFTGSRLDELTPLKLTEIYLKSTGVPASNLATIGTWGELKSLTLWYGEYTDDNMRAFSNLTKLESLELLRTGVGLAGLAHFANCRQLTFLATIPPPEKPAPEFSRLVEIFPKLSYYRMEGPRKRQQVAALAAFRNLETVEMQRVETSEEAILGVLDLPKLKTLRLMYGGGNTLTQQGFDRLAAHKSLENLISDSLPLLTDDALMVLAGMKQLKQLALGTTPKLTTTGIAAFKKKRPDVMVKR